MLQCWLHYSSDEVGYYMNSTDRMICDHLISDAQTCVKKVAAGNCGEAAELAAEAAEYILRLGLHPADEIIEVEVAAETPMPSIENCKGERRKKNRSCRRR